MNHDKVEIVKDVKDNQDITALPYISEALKWNNWNFLYW